MSERTVSITRIFDAPPERVFAAWTSAEHLARWFGPRGFTIPACEADARPGGVFRVCLRSPQGVDYWARGEYREVIAPERLVIACTAEDPQGIPRLQELIDVTFTRQGRRTQLHLVATASGTGTEADVMLEGMPAGWAQTVARLDTHLKPRS